MQGHSSNSNVGRICMIDCSKAQARAIDDGVENLNDTVWIYKLDPGWWVSVWRPEGVMGDIIPEHSSSRSVGRICMIDYSKVERRAIDDGVVKLEDTAVLINDPGC